MDTELRFGEWFEDLYKSQGLIQDEVAAMLEVDQSTVSGWVSKGQIPRRKTCILIAEQFNVGRVEVLERAGHRVTQVDREADAAGSVPRRPARLDDPFLNFWASNSDKLTREQKQELIDIANDYFQQQAKP